MSCSAKLMALLRPHRTASHLVVDHQRPGEEEAAEPSHEDQAVGVREVLALEPLARLVRVGQDALLQQPPQTKTTN